jgi:Fe-S cluster assembly ATPase SufC
VKNDDAEFNSTVPLLDVRGLNLSLGNRVALSGGELRRIELAAVLGMAPRLAILDEPTAGIDLLSLDEVVGVIRGMAGAGCAVLLITHQQPVAAMADSASQLCGGRIVCHGRVEIGAGADLTYQEAHYHGASGGIEVTPRPTARPSPRCWVSPRATPPMPAAMWIAWRLCGSGHR